MASLEWVILFCCINSVCSNKYCDTSGECIGQTLNDPEITQIRGYKAAFGPSTSFSGGKMSCSGSFSCHSMQFIRAYMSLEKWTINCKARDSCSNTIMETNDSSIQCHGTNSCRFSNITIIYDASLSCDGYLSCSNTYIHGVEHIQSSGSLSLYNATIDSIGSINNTIYIDLDGISSGFGAKLICRENHICYVRCRGYDSCYMFYTQCIGLCIVNTTTLSSAPITNITQFNTLNIDVIPTVFKSEAVMPSNDELCTMETWNFDDYEEHIYASDITVNNEGPICCRGHDSCRYINQIRIQSKISNVLMCDGLKACGDSNIISNNGTIYCQGQESCFGSSITNAHDVYCSGRGSCEGSIISDISSVTCSGLSGCKNSIIISRGSNLNAYLFARASGDQMTLYCNDTDSCNIYCYGYDSCGGSTLYCNGNCVIECNGMESECPVVYGVNAHTTRYASSLTPIDTEEPTATYHVSTIYSTSSTDKDTSLSPIDTDTHITMDSFTSTYLKASDVSKSSIFTSNEVDVNKEKAISNKWMIAVIIVIICCFIFVIVIFMKFCYDICCLIFVMKFWHRNKVEEMEQKVQEQELNDNEAKPVVNMQEPTLQKVRTEPNDMRNMMEFNMEKVAQNVISERNRRWSEGMQRENNNKIVYNMDIECDEIVIGDDELTTGR